MAQIRASDSFVSFENGWLISNRAIEEETGFTPGQIDRLHTRFAVTFIVKLNLQKINLKVQKVGCRKQRIPAAPGTLSIKILLYGYLTTIM